MEVVVPVFRPQICGCNVILLCVFVALLISGSVARIQIPENEVVPAVILFGDSIVDPGNNNNMKTLIKCNFLPYGRDFEAGPTGRFCNGKIPSDLLAEELGIKEYVPAYADRMLQPKDLVTGVSFATGGCGYDPLTPKIVSVASLSDQLVQFEEYLSKITTYFGQEKTDFILAKSLFLVVAGSDDISNTYFIAGGRFLRDASSYTDFVAKSASDFFKELYRLGARRIGVFSAPPLGCIPAQRTLAGGKQRNCAENINQAAELYNSKLSSAIDSLNNDLPGARIVYIDIYSPLMDTIQQPDKYGFKEASRGCCGTGTIEVTLLCNQYSPYTCPNASDHVFWDSFHPTERTYSIIISEIGPKYVAKFF